MAKAARIKFSESQLRHAFKHAKDFGIGGNANKTSLAAFARAIEDHVADPSTEAIQGFFETCK